MLAEIARQGKRGQRQYPFSKRNWAAAEALRLGPRDAFVNRNRDSSMLSDSKEIGFRRICGSYVVVVGEMGPMADDDDGDDHDQCCCCYQDDDSFILKSHENPSQSHSGDCGVVVVVVGGCGGVSSCEHI